MSYLYRCCHRVKGVVCGKRRALKHHHSWYIRKPKCSACNHELVYVDAWQMKKNKENTCNCNAFHYPHRAGSDFMCIEFKGELTQEQINEFHERERGYR
jgi:hypothetical protein